MVANKPMMPRSSTMDGHSPFLLGLTRPQPQQHTSGLGEYLGLAVKNTGSCLAGLLLLFRVLPDNEGSQDQDSNRQHPGLRDNERGLVGSKDKDLGLVTMKVERAWTRD